MLRARENGLKRTLENMDFEDKPQYNVFQDYLGLINVICPADKYSTLSSSSGEYLFDTTSGQHHHHRHRMDSLDSDGISDSSSSGDSRESEVLMESPEMYVYPLNPSPPTFPPILEVSSYQRTLETLIAAQKSVLSRLQPVVKDNRTNKNSNKATVCVFCRNNGESREFYSSHTLKDSEGNTSCPILRAYTCPLCKANGDNSHTIKYCPKYTPKLKVDKLLGLNM